MKYVLAVLIPIGCLVALVSIIVLMLLLGGKIKEWEWDFSRKHAKYSKFKETMKTIMAWVVGIVMLAVLLGVLVLGYFETLRWFN